MHFRAILAEYENCIKTAYSFNQYLHHHDHQILFVGGPRCTQQIQFGGQSLSLKSKNIFAVILTSHHEIWHIDTYRYSLPYWPLKIYTF